MPKKKSQKRVIEEFFSVHGNYYDYKLVVYKNTNSKVIVICPKHGDFLITPHHHINGVGCRSCFFESIKTTKEEFVRRAKNIWGNIYDYSLFSKMPAVGEMVEIKCNLHETIFSQEPRNHIKGHTGCNQCKSLKMTGPRNEIGKIKTQKSLNDSFVEKARKIHGDFYDYSYFEYISSGKKGVIICSVHGSFSQTPGNHLKGTICPKCSRQKLTVGSFREKCLEKGIDYHRALKRRQAGLSDEKIFSSKYIRNEREINKIRVFGKVFPNIEEAVRVLNPPASPQTISRWLKRGMRPEEAFDRIPNPGYADGIIYLITNKVNGKRYVGLTVQSLERRWKYHQEQAYANRIKSKDSLHASIRKYGVDNFLVETIDSGTTKSGLEKKEKIWIQKLNTLVPNGLNISTGGVSGGSNSKPTTIDGKKFKSVKDAALYVSETRKISFEAAKRRISSGKVDVRTPSKPGESYVNSKTYKAWSSIKHGIINPNSKSYNPDLEFYENWNDFFAFRNDVGEPSDKEMVFKRIDQEKGYFPNNCKWMSKSEASKINAQFRLNRHFGG